jgi:NAD(P)-dependent dehydrogenase (short-subunit alcohol dehydrogenase family)
MSGTYVIAGGSHGIGLEIVRMLAPTADRIDVWSRTGGDLPSAAIARRYDSCQLCVTHATHTRTCKDAPCQGQPPLCGCCVERHPVSTISHT